MSQVLLVQGNALRMPLRDKSVHCVITSPPYFGLRDYGTGTWEGGNPACDHRPERTERTMRRFTNGQGKGRDDQYAGTSLTSWTYRDATPHKQCKKCGAVRLDNQLGLEALHDCLGWATGAMCDVCWVCRMRQVFAEVWRVLRNDGVMFLNVGDSYYSNPNKGGSSTPNGRNGRGEGYARGLRAQSYGTDDRAKQGYQDRDSTSGNPCDVHKGAVWNHILCIDARHVVEQAHGLLQQILACMRALRGHLPTEDSFPPQQIAQFLTAILDQGPAVILVVEQLHGVLTSTNFESLPRLQAFPTPNDAVLACLSSLHSLVACARRCVNMLDESLRKTHYRQDTASPFVELEHCIRCTSGYCSLVSSWLNIPYVQPYYTTQVLKSKTLLGMPWRLALALQQDGWILRSDIIWEKPSCMPESAKDRPTRSHEYVFLFAKQARYFWDAEAIREPMQEPGIRHSIYGQAGRGILGRTADSHSGLLTHRGQAQAGRNARTVWRICSEPLLPDYRGHYASFPTALVEKGIKAGTSQHGVCGACGSPWRRILETTGFSRQRWAPGEDQYHTQANGRHGATSTFTTGDVAQKVTTGWQPSCACDAPVTPAIVFDPFVGSGTTLLAARALGRHGIGTDLSWAYVHAIARERLGLVALARWEGASALQTTTYTDLPLFASKGVVV